MIENDNYFESDSSIVPEDQDFSDDEVELLRKKFYHSQIDTSYHQRVLTSSELHFCSTSDGSPSEFMANFREFFDSWKKAIYQTYGKGPIVIDNLPYQFSYTVFDEYGFTKSRYNHYGLIVSNEDTEAVCKTVFLIVDNIIRFLILNNIAESSQIFKRYSASLQKTLDFWFSLVCYGLWEKYSKKVICYLFHKAMNKDFSKDLLEYRPGLEDWPINEPNLPIEAWYRCPYSSGQTEFEDDYYLGGTDCYGFRPVRPGLYIGSLQLRLENKIMRANSKAAFERKLSYCFGLLQGLKRGFPPISEEVAKKTVDETVKLLSEEKQTPSFILERIREDSKYLFRSFFSKFHDSFNHDLKFKGSSSFDYTRSQGGSFRGLVHQFFIDYNDENLDGFSERSLHTLLSEDKNIDIVYRPYFHFSGMKEYNGVVFSIYESDLYQSFKDWLRTSIELGTFIFDHIPHCQKLICLSEALKARIITAGESLANVIYKPCQEALLECLGKFSTFGLTHSSNVKKLVEDYFWRNSKILDSDSIFVSGDFDATTNRLHSDCSIAALDGIFDNISEPFVERRLALNIKKGLKRSLCNCLITIPDKDKKKDLVYFEQKNGQLMGCITSFPLLCAINYSIARYALSYTHKQMFDSVLINGDDILFHVQDRATYDDWANLCTVSGLVPSQGKNYCSQTFVMINSRMFYVEKANGILSPYYIPYTNMGLYMGVPRSADPETVHEYRMNCCREIADHPWPKFVNADFLNSMQHNRCVGWLKASDLRTKSFTSLNETEDLCLGDDYNLISCGATCYCCICKKLPSIVSKTFDDFEFKEYGSDYKLSKFGHHTFYSITREKGMDLRGRLLRNCWRFGKNLEAKDLILQAKLHLYL